VILIAFVRVDETEPLEKAIKRFKRMVEKEGIIKNRKNKALKRKQMKKVRKLQSMKNY